MPAPLFFIFAAYFVFGTAVGSFLNVVSRRLLWGKPPGFPGIKPRGFMGLLEGRSHCESCGKTLSGADLIPLLSFFLLRGRCRYCGAKFSRQYPLVEVGTGLLFAALGLKFDLSAVYSQLSLLNIFPPFLFIFSYLAYLLSFISLLIASSSLIVVFITDLLKQRVFDQVVLVGILAALLYRVSLNPGGLAVDLGLAAGVFAFFWFLRWATHGRGMGEGDPPVGFLTALLVGFPQGLVMLFLAFVFGAIVGLLLILLKKKKLGDQVPFGPFLVAATFVSIFFGESILSWYLGLLGI